MEFNISEKPVVVELDLRKGDGVVVQLVQQKERFSIHMSSPLNKVDITDRVKSINYIIKVTGYNASDRFINNLHEYMSGLTENEYVENFGTLVLMLQCLSCKSNCKDCRISELCSRMYPVGKPFFHDIIGKTSLSENQLLEILTEYSEV